MMTEKRKDLLFNCGQGSWWAFAQCGLSLEPIMAAAESWRAQLRGIKRAWLCWHVSDDWSLVQQRLVASIGWTPVVGFDPRVGPPRHLVKDAILIDFNRGIDLPVMYAVFPLEFAFLFVEDRLAFWHSDLLVRRSKLEPLARRFEALKDGETAATWVFPGWRNMLLRRRIRYWELIGCTTPAASRDQFEKGAGWWKAFWDHPNCTDERERQRRQRYYWDNGTGIYYWHKVCGGRVVVVDGQPLEEGHCTRINNPSFKPSMPIEKDAQRLMTVDLANNFDLAKVCRRLELEDLLAA
jgi:hypothetical protein